MLSIGELSRACALTVKTLRHYHERGLLVPTHIDPTSGYRYYGEAAVERANVIKELKALDFSLDDIAAILEGCDEDADALHFLESQRAAIGARLAHLRSIRNALDTVIHKERETQSMTQHSFQIEDKVLPIQFVAGIRMRGRFDQCKGVFKQLGRTFGMGLSGKPGMLIYDEEYKDTDADFEPYFPLKPALRGSKKAKQASQAEGQMDVRELPGGRALCLMHRGPYDQISKAYARLLAQLRSQGLKARAPSREVYHKGPGMLFKGNPNNYLTEVQILVQ